MVSIDPELNIAIDELVAGESANKEIPRRERLAARLSLDELFEGANDKKTRNQRIHQAVHPHKYPLKEVGEFVGLSYSTISVIARYIDEEAKQRKRRSEPSFL